jgi:hypothetical protein
MNKNEQGKNRKCTGQTTGQRTANEKKQEKNRKRQEMSRK